jgi:hypothetical protein
MLRKLIRIIAKTVKPVLKFLLPKKAFDAIIHFSYLVEVEYKPRFDDFVALTKLTLPARIKVQVKRFTGLRSNDLARPLSSFYTCDGTMLPADDALLESLEDNAVECELVICCAFTGRHRILELIVDETLKSVRSGSIRWMLSGSSPEDEAFIRALAERTRRVSGFICENKPLGRKWQTCMKFASLFYKAELYGITGSDDIISTKLIEYLIDQNKYNIEITENPDFLPSMYGTLEWLICHINGKQPLVPEIIKCNYAYESAFEPLGAGRFYTRSFIEECEGIIFDSSLNRLLDDRGYFELRNRGRLLEYYSVEEGPLISVKGDWGQMNPVSDFLAANTLALEEYTFEGYDMLSKCLSRGAHDFLFKSSPLAPQFNFSAIPRGLD